MALPQERFQPGMSVFLHSTFHFYSNYSTNPDTTLLRDAGSSPQQTPSQLSALPIGLHKGLTKQMLLADIHCWHPRPKGWDHVPFRGSSCEVSTTAPQAGWQQNLHPRQHAEPSKRCHLCLTVGFRMEQVELGSGTATKNCMPVACCLQGTAPSLQNPSSRPRLVRSRSSG